MSPKEQNNIFISRGRVSEPVMGAGFESKASIKSRKCGEMSRLLTEMNYDPREMQMKGQTTEANPAKFSNNDSTGTDFLSPCPQTKINNRIY